MSEKISRSKNNIIVLLYNGLVFGCKAKIKLYMAGCWFLITKPSIMKRTFNMSSVQYNQSHVGTVIIVIILIQ